MNETNRTGGQHNVRGRLAYVEQEPFIFSATIRENVCFGLPHDEKRFEKAVRMSQLYKDMENFANGEETVIGERGINISGGQKARISLARAIYSNADIYLLDDPLSAVDPEVANAIFKECISEYLSDKLVVLVTHQLQFIKNCERILVLSEKK